MTERIGKEPSASSPEQSPERARRAAIVGCGVISKVYFEAGRRFESFDVVACSDVDEARAISAAESYGVRRLESLDAVVADPEIDIVVNLTPPGAHHGVTAAALRAGKHVYSEKPLSGSADEAAALLAAADAGGLRLGCAPDTFLGAGLQACRRLIDEGAIGTPVAAHAAILSHGPDHWHPDPTFFYQPGGGPLFDMGPYYLTALVSLLGPIRRVSGVGRASFATRTVTSAPRAGSIIDVKVPTHVSGVVEMSEGPLVTLTTSFDVWASTLPPIEIYGSEGTLGVPDPNRFGGPVRLWRRDGGWQEVELEGPYTEQSRGIGIADMSEAMRRSRPHRASGELALHVLEAMDCLLRSSEEGAAQELKTTTGRPAPLPTGLQDGKVDR